MLDLKTVHWPCQFGPFSVTGGSYTQAGTGDPTPANVRAITAWKAANASTACKRIGKNHFTNTLELGYYDAAGAKQAAATGYVRSDSYSTHKPGQALMLSFACTLTPANIGLIYYIDGTFSRRVVTATTNKYLLSAPTSRENGLAFYVDKADLVVANVTNVQMEQAASATTYEPYIEKACTLAAPAEMYAGYLGDDWYWRRTYGIVDLGTLAWAYNSTAGQLYFYSSGMSALIKRPATSNIVANIVCSIYKATTANAVITNALNLSVGFTADGYLVIMDTDYTVAATFKTSLSGAMLCYELTTPALITPVFP